MQQLFFKFPIKSEYLAEDFLITAANYEAFTYLNQWPNWGDTVYSKIILLYGDSGSGKTHLAYIWKNLTDAKIITLPSDKIFTHKSLILEDIDNLEQESLLHVINLAQENQQYLLLTACLSPMQLKFSLADLRSRILAIPAIAIASPDNDLLRAILLKYLSDRQLEIHSASIDYIIMRIDRSFSMLRKFIDELDRLSKSSKRSITIPLIKQVMEKL